MNSYSFNTSVGWITLKSNGCQLVSVKFGKLNNYNSTKNLIKISKQIKLYTLGKLKEFKLNYEISGSPLQIKIWKELKKIKYGKKKSYGEIAKKLIQLESNV